MNGIAQKRSFFSASLSFKGFSRRFVTCLLIAALTLFAPMLFASTGGGEAEGSRNWLDFAWRTLNFAVLAALLYWLLAGKVKDFLSGRQNEIAASLNQADAAKEAAQKKHAEYDAKLNKATEEIRELAEMIRMQGLADNERIIANAQRTAQKMQQDAQQRMEQELKQARNELRTEAVRLSIQMAEGILKKQMKEADHVGMVKNYIDTVTVKH